MTFKTEKDIVDLGSPVTYRLTRTELLETLENWDSLMNFRVRLIACGGTALTLLNIKESTKDVDFLVPNVREHQRLMRFLKDIGYEEKGGGLGHSDDPYFLYQFWSGNRVFMTELEESPLLEGNHIFIHQWSHIYLGALNLIDLIITKIFRATSVDMDDCAAVLATGRVDLTELLERYVDAANYDVNPERMMQNFLAFATDMASRGLVDGRFVDQVESHI